jgi:hypothetical protein
LRKFRVFATALGGQDMVIGDVAIETETSGEASGDQRGAGFRCVPGYPKWPAAHGAGNAALVTTPGDGTRRLADAG